MAKGTKEVSWTTSSGNVVTLTLTYESIYIPSSLVEDGWAGSTKERYICDKDITMKINSEDMGTAQEILEITPESGRRRT